MVSLRKGHKCSPFEVCVNYIHESGKASIIKQLSTEQRETLELALISDPGVAAVKENGFIYGKQKALMLDNYETLILIQYCEGGGKDSEKIGVAINMSAALEHTFHLAMEHPESYSTDLGKFIYTKCTLIR